MSYVQDVYEEQHDDTKKEQKSWTNQNLEFCDRSISVRDRRHNLLFYIKNKKGMKSRGWLYSYVNKVETNLKNRIVPKYTNCLQFSGLLHPMY